MLKSYRIVVETLSGECVANLNVPLETFLKTGSSKDIDSAFERSKILFWHGLHRDPTLGEQYQGSRITRI